MRPRSAAAALLAAALALGLAGCTSGGAAPATVPVITPSAPSARTSPLPSGTPAGLAAVHDPGRVTGTLAGRHCALRGEIPYQLPDPACTPGAYDPAVDAAVICARTAAGRYAYDTGTYRPPASATSRFKAEQAYPAYGLPPGTRSELDHLVPLLIGGSNDAANLWPQLPVPGRPVAPNVKDRTELALRTWICAAPAGERQGRQDAAVRAVAADWVTALAVLGVPRKDVPATVAASASAPGG